MVRHLVWDQAVRGSNPRYPTMSKIKILSRERILSIEGHEIYLLVLAENDYDFVKTYMWECTCGERATYATLRSNAFLAGKDHFHHFQQLMKRPLTYAEKEGLRRRSQAIESLLEEKMES